MRLLAYVRVSRVMGRDGASFQSPTEQRRAIESIVALTPGATIVGWVEELDESGGTMDRPGVQRVIRAIDNGEVDGVVMAYLSRWARTPAALERIEAWAKQGKVFLSAAERIDTTTSHGMFALGVLLLVAKLDLDRHTETWAASTRNAIERGVAIRVPYGYERGPDGRLVPVEPAASVVRDIFRRRAAGDAVAAITRDLNDRGVAPVNAAQWTRQSVRALLRIRTYLGEAKYGASVNVSAHEPLVSARVFDAAQTPRQAVNTRHGQGLLSGLVLCAGCGYAMGCSSSRGFRRYGCNRHHGGGTCPTPTTATAHLVEDYVTAQFLARYGHARTAGGQGAEVDASGRAVERARTELEWWRDDVQLRATIGAGDYIAGLASRRVALDDAQAAHARTVRASTARGLSADPLLWATLNVAQRRVLLTAGIDAVILRRPLHNRIPIAARCDVVFIGDQPRVQRSTQGRPGVLRPVLRDP